MLKHKLVTLNMPIQRKFTVPQVGKGGNNVIIIDQDITNHTNSTLTTYRHAHSKETYQFFFLRVHQFAVQQVGKGGSNVIVIDQVITHHTNSTLRMYRHAHSKETYSLKVHQFTVQQVGKGGNDVIVIDQVIIHHTKLNPKNVQTCQFQGNLLAESAPVHSTASGERRKRCY